MSVYMLLQVLTLLALLALGVYYRRRRLVLLVEPTRRRARGLLGVGGTLMLLLAWLLLRDLAATHGHVFAGGLTAILLSVVRVDRHLAECRSGPDVGAGRLGHGRGGWPVLVRFRDQAPGYPDR